MKFTIYQESRPGRRPTNEDRIAYSYSRDSLLMVVADGMGGHLHGEVAAQIAAQYITEAFQREAHPLLKDPFLFLSCRKPRAPPVSPASCRTPSPTGRMPVIRACMPSAAAASSPRRATIRACSA